MNAGTNHAFTICPYHGSAGCLFNQQFLEVQDSFDVIISR